MGFIQNVAIAALFGGAYISNPDEDSFRRFLESEYKRGKASWLEAKLASMMTSNLIERDNYYFFSIVRIPAESVAYLGLFSRWFPLPSHVVPGGRVSSPP